MISSCLMQHSKLQDVTLGLRRQKKRWWELRQFAKKSVKQRNLKSELTDTLALGRSATIFRRWAPKSFGLHRIQMSKSWSNFCVPSWSNLRHHGITKHEYKDIQRWPSDNNCTRDDSAWTWIIMGDISTLSDCEVILIMCLKLVHLALSRRKYFLQERSGAETKKSKEKRKGTLAITTLCTRTGWYSYSKCF